MSQLGLLLLLKGTMLLSHSLVLLSITHTETAPVELRKRYQTNSLPVTRKHQQKCKKCIFSWLIFTGTALKTA